MFKLVQKQSNSLMNMIEIDGAQYIFRCKSCNKFAATKQDKKHKYIQGIALTASNLVSPHVLKQMKRGRGKHVDDVSLHIQSIQSSQKQQILVIPLNIKVGTTYFML